MFAVIVLGIGFIMVAAMFPVMISQSKMTVDETTAAATARGALAQTARIAEGGDNPNAVITQLLPPTDLYFAAGSGGPATGTAIAPNAAAVPDARAATPAGFTIQAGQQISIPGKVLSFNDARLDPAIRANLWNSVKGNLISPSDTRYAWVPLYRRDSIYYNPPGGGPRNFPPPAIANSGLTAIDSPFATVYFIPVAVRNRTLFDTTATSRDLVSPNATGGNLPNLEPRPVRLQILPNAASLSGYVMVMGENPVNTTASATGTDFTQASKGQTLNSVAEGSFVIVSDDRIIGPLHPPATGTNVNQGRFNGRIYRLGTRRADLDGSDARFQPNGRVYETAPGYNFTPEPGADNLFYNPAAPVPTNDDDVYAIGNYLPNAATARIAFRADGVTPTNSQSICDRAADAFVIGREITGGVVAGGVNTYEGVPQDVAAYVTFVRVN